MKFKSWALILALISVSVGAFGYNRPLRYNLKLPSQAMLHKQTFPIPYVAHVDFVLETHAGPTSAAVTTITSVTRQPDVPRNLRVDPQGTTSDVESCVVTIAGTNIHDDAISEAFTFSANDSTEQVGTKAFKTVTSVSWAADCESGSFGATWRIGIGELLGLDRCMASAGDWVFSTYNGAYESTRATVAVGSSVAVETNTADFNGTMDHAKDFVGYYIENFRCK